MTEKDDFDLVIGLKANDPIFQKLLVDRYAGKLLAIVMSRGFSRQDAEEIVSDSLYKTVKYISRFDPARSNKFAAWIARIAINTAWDKYKQIKGPPVSQSIEERAERGIQDTDAFWQEQQHACCELGKLSKNVMIQALQSLSETDQDILKSCAYGFTHKEIADRLNKTSGAVKVGYFRAKERLKQKYISILDSFEEKRTATAIKDFLGIEAVNEKTAN